MIIVKKKNPKVLCFEKKSHNEGASEKVYISVIKREKNI